LIETLKVNPSFDVLTDLSSQVQLLHNQVDCMPRDPFTFTNYFVPLRMHVDTKEQISQAVGRVKPDSSSIYYGLIIAEKAVVALIKNDPNITIIPAGKLIWFLIIVPIDISLIQNYIIANDEHLQDTSPVFETMCLPGMTE
jgi:hypothetical protein